MTTAEQVMAHARTHYEDAYVWSYVTECYELPEMEKELEEIGITTLPKAIKHFMVMEDVFQDRIADAAYHRSQA